MAKSEIIADVLNKVAEETEVSKELILSHCRQQEVVDARHMAIMLMCEYGVYMSRIASVFGVSLRSVYSVRTDFYNRMSCNKPLKISHQRILQKLRTNFEQTLKQV